MDEFGNLCGEGGARRTPSIFCLEFFKCSGESGFCQGLETQVSAFVPVPMCGCMRSVTTRLC